MGIVRIALGGILLFAAASAHAEPYRVGLELDPVTTAFSFMPGTRAVGGGAELALSDSLSFVVGYYHLGFEIPADMVTEEIASRPNEVVAKELGVAMLSGGLRYHLSGARDSLYFGLGYGSSRAAGLFHYEAEDYRLDGNAAVGLAELGYRWLWRNGFMVRLGGRYSMAVSSEERITKASGEAASAEEITDVRDPDDKRLAKRGEAGFSVAMGVMF